jgi:phospholipase/carboxylesterase
VSVPIGPGAFGYGWFPLVPGQPPEPEAFLEASSDLRTFLDLAAERYPVDGKQQTVLGFSQGGLMAYELALREPKRFAGLVVLSSWLPEILSKDLPRLSEHRGFPVLVIHGTEDEMVPIEKAHESRRVLEDFGVDLTYQEFPMGHEIRPEAMRLILRWWQDKVIG